MSYLSDMRDFSIYCAICDTPTRTKGEYVYMCCMCNDDTRIVAFNDIISSVGGVGVYLLKTTKGLDYASEMDKSST